MGMLKHVRDTAHRVEEAERLDKLDETGTGDRLPKAITNAVQAFWPIYVSCFVCSCACLCLWLWFLLIVRIVCLQRSVAAQMNSDTLVRFKTSTLFERYIEQEPLLFSGPVDASQARSSKQKQQIDERSALSSNPSLDVGVSAAGAQLGGLGLGGLGQQRDERERQQGAGVMGLLTTPLFARPVLVSKNPEDSTNPQALEITAKKQSPDTDPRNLIGFGSGTMQTQPTPTGAATTSQTAASLPGMLHESHEKVAEAAPA